MNKKAILIIIIITIVVIVITMWLGIAMNFSDIILAALIEGFLGLIVALIQIGFSQKKKGNEIKATGLKKVDVIIGGDERKNVDKDESDIAGNTIDIEGNNAIIGTIIGGNKSEK